MPTYIESLSKLQQQSLDSLKQIQATQLAALTTISQIVSDVPAFKPAAAFARSILEQQSAYATQLAGVFTATQQNVAKAAERVVATAGSTTK